MNKNKSNCLTCYVKTEHIQQCQKIYDGDSCPVYRESKKKKIKNIKEGDLDYAVCTNFK